MSLKQQLIARITAEGPVSIADYMAEALTHPTYGYYMTADPLGAKGDFTTAPEISQMFGELLGLCLAQAWLNQGAPTPFNLAELGPGRGTLMADILRATRSVPGFVDGCQICLIEASPVLRAAQRDQLSQYDPVWLDRVNDLSQAPLFLVANEFFDALPIRQFQRDGKGWRERRVGVDDDALCLGLGQMQAQPALDHRLPDTRDGDIVEHCPSAGPIIETLTERIARHGGAALVIDYGDWRSLGDTLQALRHHEAADPFANPGAADLTAHLDFEALAMAARCAYTRLTPQGVFLERLGITQRAQRLAQQLSGERQESHIAAHRRLTHPDEMGNLFKVIGFYPETAEAPPGLDT
ncbi:MAG: SAM-dependent methyltransferase [Pseudomonadota bacterium]